MSEDVTQADIHRAAIIWCSRKDRETFPEDVEYFKQNWRWASGLRAVVDEVRRARLNQEKTP